MGHATFDFTGSSVIVTGAARGIGLAVSRRFVHCGAAVTMVDQDHAALIAAAGNVGGLAVQADVTRTADVERVVSETLNASGRVDILVNNAGILRDRVLWKLTDDEWETVMAVHTGGAFRMMRACVPAFRTQRYGRVVNVTSYSGLRGFFGQANYATAKAGIVGLTKTGARELARFGVTVNAISPMAETRMTASLDPETKTAIAAVAPLGRFAEPDEIFAAVAFLATREAGYITGAVLPVDGGMAI